MAQTTGFHYNINLSDDLSTILQQDFWIMESVRPEMFRALSEPVKFEATTWIFVKKGSAKAEINLVNYEINGPTLIAIRGAQIMQPSEISSDFEASIVVMSKRFRDNLFLFFNNTSLYTAYSRHPVVSIPEEMVEKCEEFMRSLRGIMNDKRNPYAPQALIYEVTSFIFRYFYRCYEKYVDEVASRQGRMSDRFLMLVQEHFRKERFLEFYAKQMEVTPKHLSRTVKSQTGYTAVEWIERFVILEAKVMLKSSNLNIQQISDELNFPSQSFFGKYFKKFTGMSPKEFRNS